MATATKGKKKSVKKKSPAKQVLRKETGNYERGLYALSFAVVAWLAYGLAVDRGSLVYYGIAVAAIYGVVHNAKLFVAHISGR